MADVPSIAPVRSGIAAQREFQHQEEATSAAVVGAKDVLRSDLLHEMISTADSPDRCDFLFDVRSNPELLNPQWATEEMNHLNRSLRNAGAAPINPWGTKLRREVWAPPGHPGECPFGMNFSHALGQKPHPPAKLDAPQVLPFKAFLQPAVPAVPTGLSPAQLLQAPRKL